MTEPQYNQTNERRFPVEILGRDRVLRPNGVIWSTSTKTVLWNSPWEDNMTLQHLENTHYTQLKIDYEANGWKVHALFDEAG